MANPTAVAARDREEGRAGKIEAAAAATGEEKANGSCSEGEGGVGGAARGGGGVGSWFQLKRGQG